MALNRKKTKRKRGVKSVSETDATVFAEARKFATSVLDIINTKEPVGVLMSADPELASVRGWVETDFPWFDWMLSDGRGVPIGRALQFWGEFGTCKSSFAQKLISNFQAQGGVAVYFDFEYALDPKWLVSYGVNPNLFIAANPETLQEAFDIIFETLKESKNAPDVPLYLVWDSVAQALPQVEKDEKDFAAQHIAPLARAFSKGCRKLLRRLSRRHATMVFINQTKKKIGASAFEDPNLRPGGQALDFASSAIIRMYRAKLKKERKKRKIVWGYKVTMRTDKNRLASPYRSCEIIVDFKGGPNVELSLHHLLKSTGFIVAAGAKGTKLKGYDEAFKSDDWVDFHRENRKAVKATVKSALASLSSEE